MGWSLGSKIQQSFRTLFNFTPNFGKSQQCSELCVRSQDFDRIQIGTRSTTNYVHFEHEGTALSSTLWESTMIVSWKAWKSFKSEWLSSLVTCPSPLAPADCSEPQDVAPSARHCWWECPGEETRQPEARAQPEPQSHHSWRNKRWLVATCCWAIFLWQWHIPCRQVEDKIKASTQDKQTPNPRKNI